MDDIVVHRDPIIDFSTIIDGFSQDVFAETYADLGDIRGQKITNIIERATTEFNRMKANTLFSSRSEFLDLLIAFLRSKVPIKMCQGLALNWPPVVPMPIAQIRAFFYLLVRMCMGVANPENFLYWSTRAVFPRLWSKKSCKCNPVVAAISHCSSPQYGENLWAILDVEYRITLYAIKGERTAPIFKAILAEIEGSTEKNQVICLDGNGKELVRFLPDVPDHVQYWASVLQPEKRPPFPFFFSTGHIGYPMPYKIAVYEAVLTSDLTVLRCLIHNNVLIKDPQKVIEALYNVFTNDGKYSMLLEALVASEFDDVNLKPEQILRQNSSLTCLFKVIAKKSGKPYFDVLTSKIVKYVDSKGDLKINNPAECDKETVSITFFTVFKYIFSSLEYVPLEIQHIANVLRSYIIVRFNDKTALLNCLSGFFFLRFLTPSITNPAMYDNTIHIDNQSSLLQFAKLFQVVCNFQLMSLKNPDFVFMDDRIEHHIFPEIEKFLFAIGDYQTFARYKPPSSEDLEESIITVADSLADSYKEFMKMFNLAIGPSNEMSSTVGWNFASAMASMYPQAIDKERILLAAQHKAEVQGEGIGDLANIQPMDYDPNGGLMNVQPMEYDPNGGLMNVQPMEYDPNGPMPEFDQPPMGYDGMGTNQFDSTYIAPGGLPPLNSESLPPVNSEYLPPLDSNNLPPLNSEDLPPVDAPQDELPAKESKGKKGKRGKKGAASKTIDASAPISEVTPVAKKTGKKGRKGASKTLEGANTPSAEVDDSGFIPSPKPAGKKGKGKSKGPSLTLEGFAAAASLLAPAKKLAGKKGKKKGKGAATIDEQEAPVTLPVGKGKGKGKGPSLTLEGIATLNDLLSPVKKLAGKKGRKGELKTLDGTSGLSKGGLLSNTMVPAGAAKLKGAQRKGSLGDMKAPMSFGNRSASVEPAAGKKGKKGGPSLTLEGNVDINALLGTAAPAPKKTGGKKGKKKGATPNPTDDEATIPPPTTSTPKKRGGKKGKKGAGETPTLETDISVPASAPAPTKKGKKGKGKKA